MRLAHLRGAILLLGASMACQRHGNTTSAVPNYPIDGAYRFLIDVPGVYMTGRFVLADTLVYLDADADCQFADAPKSSDGLRSTWYDCNRTRDGAFLQLRISQVDPVKKSLWYARMRVPDTETRCTQYTVAGDCVEVLRARGMKWVDRYGAIIVTRGLPGTPPDSVLRIVPHGSKPLRARCDTIATKVPCSGDSRRGTAP